MENLKSRTATDRGINSPVMRIVVGVLSLFFLIFGIDRLIASYEVKNPHFFIMYFFSSNLMILVSIVGIIFSCIGLARRKNSEVDESDEDA